MRVELLQSNAVRLVIRDQPVQLFVQPPQARGQRISRRTTVYRAGFERMDPGALLLENCVTGNDQTGINTENLHALQPAEAAAKV
jgi:hypothetical protein